MRSGRRRPLFAVVIAASCLAALVPGVSRAYSAPADAALVKQLAKPTAVVASFVHFTNATPFLDGIERVKSNGLKIGAHYRSANSVYAYGPALGFSRLRADVHIARLEFPGRLAVDLESATWATGARSLNQQTGGLDLRVPAPGGGFIDGTGSGVAIVDSGTDGSHPDLDWCGNGPVDACKTVKNFKIACSTPLISNATTGLCFGPTVMQEVENSDTSSGHGTHVSGIAAGTGGKNNGMYRGVAPGAKLYGFGSGDGDSIVIANAALAYQWIIDHHADPLGNGTAPVPGAPADPPIVVINNSYGNPDDYRADDLLNVLADAAVAEGIAVVWSAGNDAGAGGRDCADPFQEPVPCTSGYSANPTPGVISVANYDDGQSGLRDNQLDTTSSRGVEADPATWPDVSAPGASITSTCPVLSLICGLGAIAFPATPLYYGTLSGTSMAAPHVAGVIALLHQADPTLTPAQLEDLVQDTAHRFTAGAGYAADPQNVGGVSSFDKGAGLADARLSVLRILGLPEDLGSQTVGPEVSIDVPADGATTSSSFAASGSAISRTVGGPQGTTPVLADETGQLDHVVASMDLQTLRLSEPAGGLLQVEYTVLSDTAPPPVVHSFDLFYAHDGGSGRLSLDWDPGDDSLGCSQVFFDGTTNVGAPLDGCVGAHPASNTFTLTFPVAEILNGRPVTGTVLHGLWVGSYLATLIDVLPGGIASGFANPQLAQPYVLTGASTDAPGNVTVSVDGADPVATLPGTGAFGWSAAVGPLAPGTHTLRASLVVGGVEVAADTATFTSS